MSTQAKAVQYTVRDVPSDVDRQLRLRASARHQSLNQVIVSTLAEATLGSRQFADFSELVGQWPADATLDRALKSQRRVDKEMWK